MALGSSAPEILLNVIETVQTLGQKPGELGPSTIVGSAAFNFLIISGISIYSVNEANDNRSKQEQEEAGTPPGVKKVQDVGVFAITTVWSIIAYLWLYIVLIDGVVKHWEAYLTLGFFFALILMAYIADCMRRRTIKGREDDKYGQGHEQAAAGEDNKQVDLKNVANLELVDFYNTLLPQEAGQKPKSEEEQKMSDDMKEFLLVEFGTTKVSEVNKDDLKAKLDGPAFIERIGYRKAVATNYKKEAIAKGQILRRENKQASILKEEKKNPKFGFSCLHYSVSEAAGAIKINILNKTPIIKKKSKPTKITYGLEIHSHFGALM